jgi:serine/threonine protein kinase
MDSIFITEKCTLPDWFHNIWTIGVHLTLGLEHIHAKGIVHRDLKPNNGDLSSLQVRLTAVLFSYKNSVWKIADFGFSVEGSSRNARDTSKARGTSCYRAPELVKEEASFTSKVDMWSLGCILYELATGNTAFRNDFHIFEYSVEDSIIQLSVPDLSPFLQHHASENIQELLHRDHRQRPNASTASRVFSTYCWTLRMSSMALIVESPSYPSYQEWKEVANSDVTEHSFLTQLVDVCEKGGNPSAAMVIRRDFFHLLAATYWEGKNFDSLILLYEDAVDKEPLDLWLWHHLFEAHVGKDGVDRAIAVCKNGMRNHDNNPCPVMVLISLYAAKGDYEKAITTYMDLSSDWKGWSQMENVLSKAMNENLLPLDNKPEEKNDLERR